MGRHRDSRSLACALMLVSSAACSTQSPPVDQPAPALAPTTAPQEIAPADRSKPLEGRWRVELTLDPMSMQNPPDAERVTGEIAFGNTNWWGSTDRFGRHSVDLRPFFGRTLAAPDGVVPFSATDTSMVTEASGSITGDSVGIDFIPRIDHLGISFWGRFYGDSAVGKWRRRGMEGSGRFWLRRESATPVTVAAIPVYTHLGAPTPAVASADTAVGSQGSTASGKGKTGKGAATKVASAKAARTAKKNAAKDVTKPTTTVASTPTTTPAPAPAATTALATTTPAATSQTPAASTSTAPASTAAAPSTTSAGAMALGSATPPRPAAATAAANPPASTPATTPATTPSTTRSTPTANAPRPTPAAASAPGLQPGTPAVSAPSTTTAGPRPTSAPRDTSPSVPRARDLTRELSNGPTPTPAADPKAMGTIRVRAHDPASNTYFATKYSLHLPDGRWMYGTLRTGSGAEGWSAAIPRMPGRYELEITDFMCGDKIWFLKDPLHRTIDVRPGEPADVTIEMDLANLPARRSLDNPTAAKCTAGPGNER